MNTLHALGWRESFALQLAELPQELGNLIPARVAMATQHRYRLLYLTSTEAPTSTSVPTPHGAPAPVEEQPSPPFVCSDWVELAGRLRELARPAVGDWVLESQGIIRHRFDRFSHFVRQAAGRRTEPQVIAANVDTVFVLTSPNDDYSPRRMERYLTAIWEGGARPVLVLNKADLCPDPEPFVSTLASVACGADVAVVSAVTGAGLPELGRYLGVGQTVALVGSSGVGKSTLVNALVGREVQHTAAIRAGDDTGRHTTTTRELVPLAHGGLLLDTPGLRELAPWNAEHGLEAAFEDIADLANRCRFRDCTHTDEPGCAVVEGITADRLDGYRRLQKEQAVQSARRVDLRRSAERQRDRQIQSYLRQRRRVDPKLR